MFNQPHTGRRLHDRDRHTALFRLKSATVVCPHDEVNDRPDSSSFPSGHTAAAVAFTAAVTPPWPAAGITLAVPTLLVSVERVQSGAHYSSDVAAGAALGLLSAWLTRQVPHLPRRQSR
ncbi:phosphatase PAP2 family protein [Streptomyces canus]|uniref:phosphatase PAP2 family protein n=1 Tax=Streptomyces canus TaxID=58343 RepID=UPI0027D78BDA|nr:phosphatase PAP2 family protein [Streptomyces canus]